MKRISQSILVLLATFAASTASAAIFDTIESVDTLKVIAAQKANTGGRMPAGKVSDPSTEDSGNAKVSEDEKEN